MSQPDVFAAQLGRRIVAEVAPGELPLFDTTWQVLDGHPKRGRRREEPLGFGVPGAGEMLVTAVASGVVTTVLQDLGRDFGSWLTRLLTRLRRKPVLPDPLPPLPPERLKQIRKVALVKARKLGLADPQATALADALVSELATSTRRG